MTSYELLIVAIISELKTLWHQPTDSGGCRKYNKERIDTLSVELDVQVVFPCAWQEPNLLRLALANPEVCIHQGHTGYSHGCPHWTTTQLLQWIADNRARA